MDARETLSLPAGEVLAITTDAAWVGTLKQLPTSAGGAVVSSETVAAGLTARKGPFLTTTWWEINQTSGTYTYTAAGVAHGTSTNVGTPGVGVSAAEYGNGVHHQTVLTLNRALPAIAGGAALGVGRVIYTLPAGACLIHGASMAVAITQTQGNITADTPDVGLGTVIASGVVSVLSGTATFENIITGQTAGDCNGAVSSVALQPTAGADLLIATGAAHTVHLNVADTWAASGDAAARLTGTVTLAWTFLG